MAGAYCRFCGNRCFVYRVLPGLNITHWATCRLGALNDMAVSGHDHTTTHNPHGPCTCADCQRKAVSGPVLDPAAPYASFCPGDPVGSHEWEPLIDRDGEYSCRWCGMDTLPAGEVSA